MYAVIKTGGKQYRVQAGDVLQVEKLNPPVSLGQEIEIKDVLMIGGEKSFVGQPQLENAKVTVVVTKQAKTRKVFVFKKKRRNGYRKFKTHRQEFTELFVKAITNPDGQTEETDMEAQVVDMEAKRAAQLADKAAAKQARLSKSAEGSAETDQTATQKQVKAKAKKTPKKKAMAKRAPSKKAGKAAAKKVAAKTTKKAAKK